MKKLTTSNLIGLAFMSSSITAVSQNIGIGTSTPASSAKLEISDASRGLLIPRVALTMTTSASPVTAPSTSLLVYNTATVSDVTPGFYYWSGTAWTRIVTSGTDWSITGNSGITASHFLGSTNAADLNFRTSNTQRMTILSGGNVGIGDATPAALFTVGNGDLFQVVSTGHTRTINASASLPAYSFVGDTDNGMYLSATNEVSFSTTGVQRMTISSGGNVGIGISTPIYAPFHVVGNALFTGTSTISASTHSTYIRGIDGYSTATTPNYTFWNGDQTGIFHPAASTIGFCTNGIGEVARFSSNRLGIGTTAPGGQLELSLDQGRKPGTSTWTIVSDERLKTIDGPYTKGLKELMQLNAIVYHYKNGEGRTFKEEVLLTQNVGFSAQQVQKVFPEAVGTDDDGYLNLNTHAILIAYLNAIKEQQGQIESLKAQNRELKKEIESIKTIIQKN